MRDMLMPFLCASKDTVPVTLVSSTIDPLSRVLYLRGNRKLWMPTC